MSVRCLHYAMPIASLLIVLAIAPLYAQERDAPPPPQPFKVAAPPAAPAPTRAQQRERQASQSIERELDQDTDVNAVEAELGQVLGNLAKQHELQIVLDPIGFEIVGVTTDQLVSLEIKDVSLRSALKTVLRPMQLTFVIRDEALLITSLDCPDRLATVRTFPLNDLLTRVDDPQEILASLELVWPAERIRDRERDCEPRASIVAGHLVVRGSPRHHELAAELIAGLTSEAPAKAE